MKRSTIPKPTGKAAEAALLYDRAQKQWTKNRLRSAFSLFVAAAKAGARPAFRVVAQFYDRGEGVRRNEEAALYWYRRAYRYGDHSSANNLGCIWRDRKKVNRALLWFRRAVKLGDEDAHLNIAKIYLHQRPDLQKAVAHLRAASNAKRATEGSKEEAKGLLDAARKSG